MTVRKWALVLAACAIPAGAAQAETLRISGVYPAGSDAAAEVQSIAVEPFGGVDGQRMSYVVEDRLRNATLGGEPWFDVLVAQLAFDSDAVLQGFAEPRFSESRFTEIRQVCDERDDRDECITYRDVEAQCLRVTATFEPDMRLVARGGGVLWSFDGRRSGELRYCPDFDPRPDFEPMIEDWIGQIADQTRAALAPRYRVRDIRIMESRRGLDRDTRRTFRDAVALTESDERAACEVFEELFQANPDQPSLMFNTGLCAEQAGNFALAEQRYRLALGNDQSDDEAQDGLARLNQRRRAIRQLDARDALQEAEEARDDEPVVVLEK